MKDSRTYQRMMSAQAMKQMLTEWGEGYMRGRGR
jgi:hypothetical protein